MCISADETGRSGLLRSSAPNARPVALSAEHAPGSFQIATTIDAGAVSSPDAARAIVAFPRRLNRQIDQDRR